MPRTAKAESLAEFLGLSQVPNADTAPPLERLSPKAFCQAILESAEYRQSLLDRVKLGSLPPAVELRIMDVAGWPKAPERFEHTGKDGKPIETVSEVRRVVVRAQELREELRGEAEAGRSNKVH